MSRFGPTLRARLTKINCSTVNPRLCEKQEVQTTRYLSLRLQRLFSPLSFTRAKKSSDSLASLSRGHKLPRGDAAAAARGAAGQVRSSQLAADRAEGATSGADSSVAAERAVAGAAPSPPPFEILQRS